jgi:hypothetical protein
MGCDGRDDYGGPRSNAMDQATQVSQQCTRYQGHEAEFVVNEAELVGTSSSNIYFLALSVSGKKGR